MIVANDMAGKKIGVFGLARSGLAAVRSLQAAGAEVMAFDDDDARLEEVGDAAANLYDADFAGLDALVVSPGVPGTHPLALKAREAHLDLIGDMELFARARSDLPDHQLVAITGTNGKSTTAALLAHLVGACGRAVALGGNIGIPVLDLEPLPAGGIYVFEVSSFQADLTISLDAEVAILLNISPDHLDRHGDMESYVSAKRRLFEMQQPGQVAIIGVDDDQSRAVAATLSGRVIPVSSQTAVPGGVYVIDGILYDGLDGDAVRVGDIADIATLRGVHNWQNAAAAYAAARMLGLEREAIFSAFADFAGLPHRLEIIATQGNITYVNDSKATNTDSAARALEAIYGEIYWIAGGLLKETALDHLGKALGNVRKAYLIGEAAPALATFLKGKVENEECGTLQAATEAAAHDAAASGGTVLLSPACASFDQFTDFEARGDAFREIVAGLVKGGAA